MTAVPELLVNEHCDTGENPLWDAERECIYWCDIPNGKIFRYDVESRSHATIYSGVPVGGFTLQANGDLLLFRIDDVALLREDGTAETLLRFADAGAKRFNDVIADPEGRVFAGTIGATETSGGLYRIDRDGSITKLFDGTGCANGMGFSPDLRTFYWTCSTRRRIYKYPYDPATGDLGAASLFYQATDHEGIPDGLCLDEVGQVWSARWDGFAIMQHDSGGAVVGRISFPVAKVSSACFGGRNLDTLYVTTAGGLTGSDSKDGALFSVSSETRGRSEFRSRITG